MTARKRAVRIPEPSEHESQVAFFRRVRLDPRTKELPIFAIANGGHRHIVTATRLKAEGVTAGVPDIFVAVPQVSRYRVTLSSGGVPGPSSEHADVLAHGIFIEMKRKGNKPTSEQLHWMTLLNKRGYQTAVCYGADAAWNTLMNYLGFAATHTEKE